MKPDFLDDNSTQKRQNGIILNVYISRTTKDKADRELPFDRYWLKLFGIHKLMNHKISCYGVSMAS